MLFLLGIFLLGILFGYVIHKFIVSRFFYDGVLVVDDNDEFKTNWTLQVKTDPENIPKKRSIRLQVHVQK